jgi:hypothetical protein
MFLNVEGVRKYSGYNRAGEQSAGGRFLMLVAKDAEKYEGTDTLKLWGIVRHVRMTQCGHYMMGTARVGGQSITVSGTYGNDGLPMDMAKFEGLHGYLTLLTVEAAKAYWNGTGGHNGAGSEATDMQTLGRWLYTVQ